MHNEFEIDTHTTPPHETWPSPDQSIHSPAPTPGGSNWVGLLVLGLVLIVMGIVALSASSQMDSGWDPSGMDQQAHTVFSLFGALMIIAGVVAIAVAPLARRSEVEASIQRDLRMEEERAEEERLREDEKEDIVRAVKSTIKIRCRYCGTLNEEKATRCESCGGSL